MKRKCKDIDITNIELIKSAYKECLKNKNKKRRDVKEVLSIGQDEYCRMLQKELIDENLKLKQIWYSVKLDSSNKKERRIGIQDIKQQIYDYIAIEGLKPMLTRIGPHQYSGIPGKGQIRGAYQIKKWLQDDRLRYYCKLDIQKCYESVDCEKLILFLEKHIKNDKLMWLIKTLISTFDVGLSIGSYLSQYLCNLYLSELYHFIYERMYRIRKKRNGMTKRVNLVHKCLFYMDDILILGSNKKDMHKAIQLIVGKAKEMGFKIKENWHLYRTSSFIDMMGYKIYRDHITVRKRVFLRIRKTVYKLRRKGMSVVLARKIVSYHGMLKHSDSYRFIKRYNWNMLLKAAKEIISNESRIYRKTAVC